MTAEARPGGILALDLSSVVGWAYGHKGDIVPLFGTWHLNEGHSSRLGPRFVAYENELIHALNRFEPRLVVMEAPLPAFSQASTNVARQQFGLAAYTEGECERRRIQIRDQPSHTVRKAVLGRGSFGSSAKAKAAVMFWCTAKGWHVPDDNAGDACVLWKFTEMVAR